MPDFTHVISSIETEVNWNSWIDYLLYIWFVFKAMSFMGSGFSAINIGDEIIEINNQVVVSLFY
jgi:hypothetical protein